MKSGSKNKILLTATIVMLSAGITALAIQYKIHKYKAPVLITANAEDKAPVLKYDTVLLRKLRQVTDVLNIKDKSCTYSGVLSVTDGSDSAQNAKNVPFLMCKQGNGCYYKMGNSETVNNGGIYMCIERDQGKIFIGPQKKTTLPDLIKSSGLKEGLIGENYALSLTKNGINQTLILSNEKHITCKEYAITYDTVTLKVKRLYARMTNFEYPLDKSKEKLLDITFNTWEDNADIDKHINVRSILVEKNRHLSLADDFKRYELIQLQ